MLTLDILVIGAGMSGLIAATQLAKAGHSVACVDKARGSGGRLSSKRITSSDDKVISFDLGCASFGAKTELFRSHLDEWMGKGLVKTWHYSEKLGTQYVAVPRSSSITRHLSSLIDMHFSTRITEIKKVANIWEAYTGEPHERALFAKTKHIVLATPPQQAADLLPDRHQYKAQLSQPIESAQWVLMLNVKGHLDLSEEYYQFEDSIIARLILEQSKPDRKESCANQTWLLHACPNWTAENLETDKSKLEHLLIAELASITGSPVIVEDTYLHRWLYSLPTENDLAGKNYLSDRQGLWFCGDYLADLPSLEGVEAAFYSGYQLSKNFQLEKI